MTKLPIIIVDRHKGLVANLLKEAGISQEQLRIVSEYHDLERAMEETPKHLLLIGSKIWQNSTHNKYVSTAPLVQKALDYGSLVSLMSSHPIDKLPTDIQDLIGPGKANYVPKSSFNCPDEFYNQAVFNTFFNSIGNNAQSNAQLREPAAAGY